MIVVMVFLVAFFVLQFPVIFQEGNPIPVAVAVHKLNQENIQLVTISGDQEKYLVKTDNLPKAANQPFIDFKQSEGYVFKDDFLVKAGRYYQVNYNAFTKKYSVITVREITVNEFVKTER